MASCDSYDVPNSGVTTLSSLGQGGRREVCVCVCVCVRERVCVREETD